jgi:hypothetical protein
MNVCIQEVGMKGRMGAILSNINHADHSPVGTEDQHPPKMKRTREEYFLGPKS